MEAEGRSKWMTHLVPGEIWRSQSWDKSPVPACPEVYRTIIAISAGYRITEGHIPGKKTLGYKCGGRTDPG